MKDLATVFIVVLLTFICSLAIFRYILLIAEMIIIIPLVLIGVNTVLHIKYAARGRISLALLPVAWAFCIAPLYICCYIAANSRASEKTIAFLVLSFVALAPVFMVSLLTSAVSRWRKRAAAKRAGQQ